MSDTAALLDALLDLKHDLGKHLLLPLSLLPKDAVPVDVARAAQNALQRTRRGPQGEQSARALWNDFVSEYGRHLHRSPAFMTLARTVEAALAWESKLSAAPLEHNAIRDDVTRDFQQVGSSILALIAEVRQQGESRP